MNYIINNYKELFCNKLPLVVFDLETTGLNANTDRIIELAALRIENEEITSSISTLVNPGIEVPYYATKVNGITTNMLTGQVSDTEIVIKFNEICRNAIIIAHNVNFDIGFINASLNRLNMAQLNNQLVDTVRLARKAFPGLKNYKLGSLAQDLNIEVYSSHRAEDDTRVCYEIFNKCLNKLKSLEK
ncbi:MAG: 3'-5' exonuclease [Spirochaetales bacterium]|nr:3'-5' exonuclease [Spirochaetales bacterium]